MSDEPGERRRRRELERARELAAGDTLAAGGTAVADDAAAAPLPAPARPVDDAPVGGLSVEPQPRSRRALRERERRLAATSGPVADDAPATPSGPAGSAAVDGEPAEVTSPDPQAGDLDDTPREPQRYTLRHYVALALVACVLAFLVWTLTTGADDAGATSAAWPAVPTLPDLPAAHQGEL